MIRKGFLTEMLRFLPPDVFGENLETDEFWTYLVGFVTDEGEKAHGKHEISVRKDR